METYDYISASVVNYNSGKKTADICRQLLEFTKKLPLKLFVIDNNSTDNSVELLRCIKGLTLIENTENSGFGKGHNLCLENVGKYHFIINPDISIDGDILCDIADFLEENKDIVVLNPKILNSDGTEQKLPKEKPTFKRLFLGRFFSRIRQEYTRSNIKITKVTDTDFCSGCFFCIKGEVFKKLNGFDDRFFMYLEDADLTLRAQNYGRTVTAPQFKVTHLWERGSAKNIKLLFIHVKSCIKFLFKWRKL